LHQFLPMLGDPSENPASNSGRQTTRQELAIFDPDQGSMTAAIDMHVGGLWSP
jgi:hypothetical protein